MKRQMKKYSIKFIAILLSLILILLSVPLTVFASFTDSQPYDNAYNHDVFEVPELRDEYTKHFKLEDGTFTAAQYQLPVHYQDEYGNWKDIDNRLQSSGSEYSTGNARIKFSKKITGNSVLFTLHDGNRKISISMDDAIKKTTGKVTNTNATFDENATQLQKLMTLNNLSSKILYKNIQAGVDLEYVVESLNIKENIIVKEKRENYSFSFTISLNNLDAVLNNDGSVTIFDPSTDQSVYKIPSPVVYDSNNQYADDSVAHFVLTQIGNHSYRLTVTANAEWMNDSSRIFPVVIDPAIYTPTGASVDDTYIDSASPTLAPYNQTYLSAGETTSAYWKATLPKLPNSAYISSATLTLNYISTTGSTGFPLCAFPVTSEWDSTLCYSQYQTGTAGDYTMDLLDFQMIDLTMRAYSWNITKVVKDWYNGSPNYGITIKKAPSGYPSDGNIKFHSNNAAVASRPALSINYKDIKGIEEYWTFTSQNAGMAGNGYVNNATGALSFSIGTMTTTDALFAFTPTLVYNQSLAGKYNKTGNAEVPYSKAMHGYGFRFNINETIVKRTYLDQYNSNVTYYIWSDSDGTEHYFLPQTENGQTIYRDEDGLLLTLNVSGASYSITDLNHNVRLFTKNDSDSSSINAGGILTSITDRNGNKLRFQYNEFGRISYVEVIPKNSSAITFFRITHNSYGQVNRILNEKTQQAVILYYSSAYNGTSISPNNGGYLRKVVHAHQTGSTQLSNWSDFMTNGANAYITADAQATYEYDSAGRLISAHDHMSDYKMEYTYTGNQVTKIVETASGKSGQEISLHYYNGYTEVRTSGTDDIYGTDDDLINVYNFDSEGRVRNSYTTDAKKSQIFGAISGEYETKSIVKNNIKVYSATGGSATNFILNGNFAEKDTNNSAKYWTQTSNGSSVKATGYVTAKNNTTDTLYQYVYLPEGQYTLSMDINTHNTKNVTVKVTAKSLSNPAHVYTDEVPVNEYYASGTTAFTSSSFTAANEQSTGGEKFQIIIQVTGGAVNTKPAPTVSFSNIMLGNGIGKSPFSMVDFGNFENYAIDAKGNSTQTCSDHWIYEYGHSIVKTDKPFGNALEIRGDLLHTQYATQSVYQANSYDLSSYDYGDPYDDSAKTFLISGFAKGTHQVANPNSYFRIRAEISYYKGSGNPVETETKDLDFQVDCNGWQYGSISVTTKEYSLIKEVKIICEYTGHPGRAYFDNISVSLDSDQSTVVNEYYDNGLVQVKRNGYYTEIYEYDSNRNLKRVANNRGEIYDYTYSTTNNVETETYYTFYRGYASNLNYPYQLVNPDQYITKTPVTRTIHTYSQYGKLLSSDTFLVDNNGAVSGTKHISTVNTYNTVPGSAIFGALTSSTDHLGRTSRYFYDQNKGYLLAAIKPDSKTGMCYEYDAIGNIKKVQPAAYSSGTYSEVTGRESVEYFYNDQQMLSKIITGSTEYKFTYNVFGQSESVLIGNNEILSYKYYDDNSNQTLINNNGNGGKLREIEYSNGFSVRYVYDSLDNIKEVWYTTNGVETKAFGYTYTTYGQLYRFDNFLDQTAIIYKYDGENRLVHYIEFDTKDDTNKLGTTLFYNDEGQLSSVFYQGDYSAGTEITDYTHFYFHAYNSDGTLKYLSLDTDTSKGDIKYNYDDYKRLSTKVVDFYRKGATTTRFTNTVTYNYVTIGAQTSTLIAEYKTKVNSNAERKITYTYDENGNITQKVDSIGRTYRYAYDDLGQLIREDDVYRNATYVYAYDDAGNILYKRKYALHAAGVTPTGSYSGKTLTYASSDWGDRLTAVNGASITYDSLGNPISYYNGYTFSWKNGNELSSVNTGSNVLSFTYDDSGHRTSKNVNGVKHIYHLDGSQVVAEEWGDYLCLYMYDAEGTPVGFQYRNSLQSKGEFSTYWFEKNAQGDIIAIYTDGGQKVVWYEYDAWGERIQVGYASGYSSVEMLNPFGYRGYIYDRETGLYYLNSRYYDPAIGRFISPDSVGVVTASPLGLTDKNLYAYCDNNPVMRRDDGGMFWDTVFDVISLGFSIADVAKNPDDPWAWVGLGADIVSLIVPFATGGGAIVKAASKVDDVVDVVKSVDKAADVIDTATDIGKIAKKADNAKDVSKAFKNIIETCFVAGTLVEAEDGSTPIEDIEIGDYVWATNPDTNETNLKRVVNTFVRGSYDLIHIKVNGERITTTPTHPFWVPEKGWIDAVDLRAGDILQLLNGEHIIIEQVQHEVLESPILVYNFEVEDFHTYYVTESAILVHNADYDTILKLKPSAERKVWKTIVEESSVTNTVKKFDVAHANAYDNALTKLASGDYTGLKVHISKDGLWSADIKGFGKGRGAARFFFTDKNGIINILDIVLDHKF